MTGALKSVEMETSFPAVFLRINSLGAASADPPLFWDNPQPETVMLKPHIDLALRRMVAMKVPKAPLLN